MRRAAPGRAALLLTILSASPARAADRPPLVWANETMSPAPAPAGLRDPLERIAIARCGAGDARLDLVARALVAAKAAGEPMPPPDAIDRLQRAAGEPHPWPSAWGTRFGATSTDAALAKLDEWLASERPVGVRRCGAARATGADGAIFLVVLAVDAIADLDPLPVRARTGQWLAIQGHLRVPARSVRVVVLGASGVPRTIPATLDGNVVRARCAVDRPGELTVQVVAELASGPRPVLEATVFGDVDPSTVHVDPAAPGETADAGWADARDDDRLARMILAARADAGVPPLVRDARLDAIAHAHAARMAERQQLAHDVGDGTPMDRVRAAGLEPRTAGENVALAATPALAHRALWNSPSHRANTIKREFDRVGIGVQRDAQGNLWVAVLFVGGLGR